MGNLFFGQMRITLTIFLTLTLKYGTSQQLNVNYRTTLDSTQRLHYLVFTDKSNCKLIFPITTHGEAMMTNRMPQQKRDFDLNYKLIGDTIVFSGTDLDTSNFILKRLLSSRFIVKSDKTIYDFVSGYTYVDNNSIDNRHTIYVVDGEIFKQKTTKTDGYGFVVKDYKISGRLRRKIKQIGVENYTMNILKGKSAYDKYGLIGMNGVIEIERKK
jgi:hypothetical protein